MVDGHYAMIIGVDMYIKYLFLRILKYKRI